ncbi:MAG: hypothetical protein HZA22_01440 [Nitrospirae bacterium]|nr:hypothetical protein [Nitrospirota bacterium]
MRLIKLLLACSMLVGLTGCFMFYAKPAKNTDPLHPTFMLSSGLFRNKPAVLGDLLFCIREDGKWKNIWRIEPAGIGDMVELSEITYGVLPPKFKENHKAPDLEVGHKYLLYYFFGEIGIPVYFEIIEKDNKPALRIFEDKSLSPSFSEVFKNS